MLSLKGKNIEKPLKPTFDEPAITLSVYKHCCQVVLVFLKSGYIALFRSLFTGVYQKQMINIDQVSNSFLNLQK